MKIQKKTGWAIAVALLVVIGVSSVFALHYYRYYRQSAVDSRVWVYVDETTTLDSLSAVFENVSDRARAERIVGHLRKSDYRPSDRMGAYRIDSGVNVETVVRRLRQGLQTPVRVTFNNIRTKRQFADRMAEALHFGSDELLSLLENDSVCASYGFDTYTIPAMFLPDTYEFYWTVSPRDFMNRMHREYDSFWNEERKAKAAKLNLKPIEVSILTSIVEEETNMSTEKGTIAGLYLNRLRKRIPMQACPTIKFALQDFTIRRILDKHLEVESPYNTYKHRGLPIGPIRIPSKSSLDAVLNLTPNNYLYMCARDDFSGYHYFSSTLAEHNRYAARYHRALSRNKIR